MLMIPKICPKQNVSSSIQIQNSISSYTTIPTVDNDYRNCNSSLSSTEDVYKIMHRHSSLLPKQASIQAFVLMRIIITTNMQEFPLFSVLFIVIVVVIK